jgi:hypothetical protein
MRVRVKMVADRETYSLTWDQNHDRSLLYVYLAFVRVREDGKGKYDDQFRT